VYRWLRDLHLYGGLFISPFILLFAVSVFYLNHGKLIAGTPPAETYQGVRVPDGLRRMKGREAVILAREILPQIGVAGEVGFLRYVPATEHVIFSVSTARREATVDVDLRARSAVVTRRAMGVWETLAYLHKMPGPHNVAIRGNWVGTNVWHWFADATVALVLFLSISGVYLWFVIKSERRAGAALLTAGAMTLCGLVYAVIR
jgi:hypothetical protein